MQFIKWIASYPRSGNTWTRSLLLAYKHGEKFDINKHMAEIPGEPGEWFYRNLWSGIDEMQSIDRAHMRALALLKGAEMHQYDEYVIKTHTANLTLDGQPLIPHSYTNRALYIKRDPLDVLVSCAKYFRRPHEEMAEWMIDEWKVLANDASWSLISSYKNHVHSWTNATFPVLVVPYEDLLSHTEVVLKQIIEFFYPTEAVSLERIKTAVRVCDIKRMQAAEKRHGFSEKPEKVGKFFGPGKSGRGVKLVDSAIAIKLMEQINGS